MLKHKLTNEFRHYRAQKNPIIVETENGFFVNWKSIPHVKRGSVTTKTVGKKDDYVEVTLTIAARRFIKL